MHTVFMRLTWVDEVVVFGAAFPGSSPGKATKEKGDRPSVRLLFFFPFGNEIAVDLESIF